MKFVRYRSPEGHIYCGVLDGDWVRRVDGFEGDDTDVSSILKAYQSDLGRVPLSSPVSRYRLEDVSLLAPLRRPSKIICVGLNYEDHMHEVGADRPEEPVIFSKFANAIVGDGVPIRLPTIAPKRVDYEAELAVIVGAPGESISEDDAMKHVAGYTVANDVTARDWQLKKPGGQWLLGKTFDGFLPLGPAIVAKDAVDDYRNLRVQTRVSGELRQDGSTSQMIFGIEEVLSYVSKVCRLEVGDVILTGTPAGIAMARGREAYLKDGDVLTTEIPGLGALRNPIVSAS